MQIQEICEMEARGKSLYTFINLIRHSPVICMNQYCKKDCFYCTIKRCDLKKLQELADSCNIAISVRETPSLLGRLRLYRKRAGIAAGILLAAGLIFYYSNTVTVIEVEGSIPEDSVRAVLASQGVTEGTWIGNIDFNQCEYALRHALPEVAWAGIRHTGSRLVVHLYAATLPGSEILRERAPCNIVSTEDAQITGVRVYDGRLVPIIGDGVHKGDLLITGVVEDMHGRTTYHHALGNITGIYTKEKEFTEYFSISESSETGRTRKERYFWLFGLQIPLQIGSRSFPECTQWESKVSFSLLGHDLPCGIIQKTYGELQTEMTVQDEETARNALNEQIFRYEKNLLSDTRILDRELEYTSDESGITCLVTYTLEGEIGRSQDIFLQ